MRRADNPIIMANIRIPQKIAWSFHRTTGIEWEELYSEAVIAYLEAISIFDPAKGKLTTLTYEQIRNRLCTFCRKQNALESRLAKGEPIPQTHSQDHASVFRTAVFHEMMDGSDSTKKIFELIMKNPHKYMKWGGRGEIKKQLRKLGWTWREIWAGISEMKEALKRI